MQNELTSYTADITLIKNAILESQQKVVQNANIEQLSLYYGIGRYISGKTRNNAWGTNAIETISEQLQKQLPGLRGFSATNMKYMRIFYETWCASLNRQPMADDLMTENEGALIPLNLLSQNQLIDFAEFTGISFSHHVEIFSKTKTLEERLFYVHQSFVLKWDKYTLRNQLKADGKNEVLRFAESVKVKGYMELYGLCMEDYWEGEGFRRGREYAELLSRMKNRIIVRRKTTSEAAQKA